LSEWRVREAENFMSVVNKTWLPVGAEDIFVPNPLLTSPCRGPLEQQLEHLKEQLLAPLLSSVGNAALVEELRWVANEATALAWFTVCPILVLPTLLEEKVRSALKWWERQERIRPRQMDEPKAGVTI
jgi:hypothetical protein